MNIQFQICGFTILILLFIFYKSHRTLKLYKEKVFYEVLCTIIISMLLDIASLFFIIYRSIIPIVLVKFICKSYIVSLLWGVKSALNYVLTDLFQQKKHQMISNIIFIVCLVQSIIIYILPIRFHDEKGVVYTYGTSVSLVYFFVAAYIAITLIIIFSLFKKLNPRRAFAVIFWMTIWTISATIQFFNNELLIVGFASAIGVLILFVLMENPEANLDRELGCFNSYAMSGYITQLLQSDQEFNVLEISFEHSDVFKESKRSVDEVMRKILHIANTYKEVLVFKKRSIGFLMVSEQKQFLESLGMKIAALLLELDSFREGVTLILLNQTDSFNSLDDLLKFLAYVRNEYAEQTGQLFCINDAIVENYNKQHLIEIEIENALEQDRIEVFLQPIYSNHKKHFTSAEALVRIRKETGELIAPNNFISIAEESGQILKIGERVFEKVCEFLKNNNVKQLGIEYIEVNLSVIQCEQENLASRLLDIVKKYNIEPRLINLEITETASVSARSVLLKNMETLIANGFSFSLDDFGSGESNLMYVVEMPVSIIKFDYDMTKAFFQSQRAQHVVRSVIKMAHDMGIKLVAEGIETKEEIDVMYREDIDYIQGFYYSKPLPMDNALKFLREQE